MIPLIKADRCGRHIGEIIVAAMRAVRLQEAEDVSFYLVFTSLRQMSSRDRDSEDAAVVKHPLSAGDCARGHEGGSV